MIHTTFHTMACDSKQTQHVRFLDASRAIVAFVGAQVRAASFSRAAPRRKRLHDETKSGFKKRIKKFELRTTLRRSERQMAAFWQRGRCERAQAKSATETAKRRRRNDTDARTDDVANGSKKRRVISLRARRALSSRRDRTDQRQHRKFTRKPLQRRTTNSKRKRTILE